MIVSYQTHRTSHDTVAWEREPFTSENVWKAFKIYIMKFIYTSELGWRCQNIAKDFQISISNEKRWHGGLTGEEMSFEAFLGDCVVWFELDSHVVVLGGDDLWNLCTTVFPMKLWVRWQATPHLNIVILTHLHIKKKDKNTLINIHPSMFPHKQ